jgi:hypothetical protein
VRFFVRRFTWNCVQKQVQDHSIAVSDSQIPSSSDSFGQTVANDHEGPPAMFVSFRLKMGVKPIRIPFQ